MLRRPAFFVAFGLGVVEEATVEALLVAKVRFALESPTARKIELNKLPVPDFDLALLFRGESAALADPLIFEGVAFWTLPRLFLFCNSRLCFSVCLAIIEFLVVNVGYKA